MDLPLLLHPDPRLRERAVQVLDEDLAPLIAHMKQQMGFYEGVGISAPQFGVAKRVFLVQNRVMINPQILELSETQSVIKEGCLSLPRVLKRVKRPETIVASWYDENGKYHTEHLVGASARIFQHEMDHLNGVLFIDYQSNFSQKWLLKKYNREQKARNHG